METCPRCRVRYFTPYGEARDASDPLPPAISRTDNKTHICSDCGTEEALMNFRGEELQRPEEWPVLDVGVK